MYALGGNDPIYYCKISLNIVSITPWDLHNKVPHSWVGLSSNIYRTYKSLAYNYKKAKVELPCRSNLENYSEGDIS